MVGGRLPVVDGRYRWQPDHRQPITDHQRKLAHSAIPGGKGLLGGLIEPTPQIGTPEIVTPAAGAASDIEGFETEIAQRGDQGLGIEGGMDGVAGARVVQREFE